jgi:hypothetical protein
MLAFDSSDLATCVTTFFNSYNSMCATHQDKIPSHLSIMPFIFGIPGLGLTMLCGFVWNGLASEESDAWLERLASFAPLVPGMPGPKEAIKPMTPYGYLTMLTSFLPEQVTSRAQTASVVKFSPDVIAALAKQSVRMPKGTGGLNLHILRAGSPACSGNAPASVCPYREAHTFVEILGFAGDECTAEEAAAWSLETRNLLMESDAACKTTYLPLTAPEFVNLQDIYGDKLEVLKQLKREYDPKGVFKLTLPRLVD